MTTGNEHLAGQSDSSARSPRTNGCCGSENTSEGSRDPVCGMAVDPHTAKHRADRAGHTYYFCSAGCRTRRCLDSTSSAVIEPVAEDTIYTCPMHPEIRQVGPGACPICGMALEPELPGETTEPNPELADMTRRFWIGLVLAFPVLALEMGGGEITGLRTLLGQGPSN